MRHLVVLHLGSGRIGGFGSDSLRGFGLLHNACDVHLMLIQNAAHVRFRLLWRTRGTSRAVFPAGVGYHRNRLCFRRDEVFVELAARLLESCGLVVESYPVVVVGSDSVGTPEYVVDVVFFNSHSVEDRVCIGRLVLENTTREQVVNVRNVEGTVYRCYHQLLEAGDDGIGYLLVL